MATTESKMGTESLPSKPVELLQNQYAPLYTHVHPVLLLSLVSFSFGHLVQDPISTLLAAVPIVALLQAIYCVVCLPSTGHRTAAPPKPGQKKKAVKPGQDIWSKIVVLPMPNPEPDSRVTHVDEKYSPRSSPPSLPSLSPLPSSTSPSCSSARHSRLITLRHSC